jgi:hypothetical protein
MLLCCFSAQAADLYLYKIWGGAQQNAPATQQQRPSCTNNSNSTVTRHPVDAETLVKLQYYRARTSQHHFTAAICLLQPACSAAAVVVQTKLRFNNRKETLHCHSTQFFISFGYYRHSINRH